MLRCRYLPFEAAQHVRYSHQMIVDDIGEMICRIAVRFDNDRIAAVRRRALVLDVARHQIVEFDGLCVDFETNAECITIRQFLGNLHWRQVSASIIIARWEFLFFGILVQLIQPLRGAKAIICAAILEQFLHLSSIDFQPLALYVWAVVAAVVYTLVRHYARPVCGEHKYQEVSIYRSSVDVSVRNNLPKSLNIVSVASGTKRD